MTCLEAFQSSTPTFYFFPLLFVLGLTNEFALIGAVLLKLFTVVCSSHLEGSKTAAAIESRFKWVHF